MVDEEGRIADDGSCSMEEHYNCFADYDWRD